MKKEKKQIEKNPIEVRLDHGDIMLKNRDRLVEEFEACRVIGKQHNSRRIWGAGLAASLSQKGDAMLGWSHIAKRSLGNLGVFSGKIAVLTGDLPDFEGLQHN